MVFERAADAVVQGDLFTLRSLLRGHPELAHERSQREHAATLLHYVSANGVEDERQRTPANVVEVATLLLDAGAEPDAVSNDGWTTLAWLVSSVHPARADKLHWACFKGQLDAAAALLAHGAPTEVQNRYGGTVLDTVAWAAGNAGEGVDYVPVVECLLAAGADPRVVALTGIAELDALIAR
jgi:ankyrin repeat protein